MSSICEEKSGDLELWQSYFSNMVVTHLGKRVNQSVHAAEGGSVGYEVPKCVSKP